MLGGDTVSQDWRPLTHVRAAGSLGARTPRNGTAWWHVRTLALIHDTIRYDTRCYFNVRSKANMSQLNLPHGTDN